MVDLDDDTPLLYINFGTIKVEQAGFVDKSGDDGHHLQSFLHAKHSKKLSFYVLIDEDLKRLFLVPSWCMEVVNRSKSAEALTDTKGSSEAFCIRITKENTVIHDFECAANDVVEQLRGVLGAAQALSTKATGKWQTKTEVYGMYLEELDISEGEEGEEAAAAAATEWFKLL
jgi:hypothetical protein